MTQVLPVLLGVLGSKQPVLLPNPPIHYANAKISDLRAWCGIHLPLW